jgi:hypothetical protein
MIRVGMYILTGLLLLSTVGTSYALWKYRSGVRPSPHVSAGRKSTGTTQLTFGADNVTFGADNVFF